ncbi:MAG: UDP-N-acetylglucosamine 4,6-dehydratase [Burkholderiaceae bacterium]
MSELLTLLGRDRPLFEADQARHGELMDELVRAGRFLVVGGAGSIGQAVVREIFQRSPKRLHVVDISENNLVEVVRDVRSSLGYIEGEFKTFALDFGSPEFDALLADSGGYDYVLNLSALKHVRSEKDPFTLMRLIDVNVTQTERLRRWARDHGTKKLFCVSTDKATNPVNMMGCSKRIMELFLFGNDDALPVSTARFANVAFSDGSLLHGFGQRIAKQQPLSAPSDVRRYFITQPESGFLCLASCLLGAHREVFFPKLDESMHLITFAEIADRYLHSLGYEPVRCATEDEARARVGELRARRQWPVYYFGSDTTGEKAFEEFYTTDSRLDWERFADLGVILNDRPALGDRLERFAQAIETLRASRRWTKQQLVEQFRTLVPEFAHQETGKYLDDRM